MVSPVSVGSSASGACACTFCANSTASCACADAARAAGVHSAPCCGAPQGRDLRIENGAPGLYVAAPVEGWTPPGTCPPLLKHRSMVCQGSNRRSRCAKRLPASAASVLWGLHRPCSSGKAVLLQRLGAPRMDPQTVTLSVLHRPCSIGETVLPRRAG